MIVLVDPNDSRAVRNKDNVLALYELMINRKKSEEGTAKFVSPAYIQHNPLIPDGPVALGQFFGKVVNCPTRPTESSTASSPAVNSPSVRDVGVSNTSTLLRGKTVISVFPLRSNPKEVGRKLHAGRVPLNSVCGAVTSRREAFWSYRIERHLPGKWNSIDKHTRF